MINTKYDDLMFKLSNCCKLFNSRGDIRKYGWRLYKDDVDLGTFVNVHDIAEYIGVTPVKVKLTIRGTSTVVDKEGWIIKKLDTKAYQDVDRSVLN